MARVTPPMESKGLFLVRPPYVVSATTVYRVGAIRTFEDLIKRGLDPVKTVYTPVGLSETNYQADIAAGANIIVLLSDTLDPVYVPDTYIESYPNMAVVPHNWVVATVSLGMLENTYDTTRLTQAIQTAVSNDIGVQPVVNIAVAPTTDAITQEQYIQNTAARNAAIKNRSTTYAQLVKAQDDLLNLNQTNQALLDLIQQLQARIAELEGSAPT